MTERLDPSGFRVWLIGAPRGDEQGRHYMSPVSSGRGSSSAGQGHCGRRGAILVAWILLPVGPYGLGSFRTPRFVFPLIVPLAVCADYWLSTTFPRLANLFARWLAPLGAVAVTVALWVAARYLIRDPNAVFKREATTLKRLIPEGEPLAYLGNNDRLAANPLVDCRERSLAPSCPSAREPAEAAGRRRSRARPRGGDRRDRHPHPYGPRGPGLDAVPRAERRQRMIDESVSDT